MTDKAIDYTALGERVQRRRVQVGLSQQEAAERLNLSTSFYSRVERGEKVASLETLVKVANFFELSLDFLLQDSLTVSLPDRLRVEVVQILMDKPPVQAERLVGWLRVLSENVDRLG